MKLKRNQWIKRIIVICNIGIMFISILLITNTSFIKSVKAKNLPSKKWEHEYGVFVGLNESQTDKIKDYHTIVIDASYFSKETITKMKRHGQKVYSYLNIGSIESFRSYYKKFESITLDEYENWSDERWVDVSDKKWKRYTVDSLAKTLYQKGIDGFFLDNIDVYDEYSSKEIYKGLKDIIRGLEKYKKDIIINGGDTFVKKLIQRKELSKLCITGINQECVFTSIDFEKKRYGIQNKEVAAYFKRYLELCKKRKLKVYLTEYGTNKKMEQKVKTYCKTKGYVYYMANSFELN